MINLLIVDVSHGSSKLNVALTMLVAKYRVIEGAPSDPGGQNTQPASATATGKPSEI